jgi:hypothetical protein
MAEQSSTETQPTGAPEATPTRLTFREKFVSTEPVVSPEVARNKKRSIVRAAGDATVVLAENDSELRVYADNGDKINISGDLTIADWEAYRRSKGIGPTENVNLVNATRLGEPDDMLPDSLPPRLRELATSEINQKGFMKLPTDSWKIDATQIGSLAIDVDDDSMVIYQPGTQNVIGFSRQDATGAPLPVKNWKRIDTLDATGNNIPLGISERGQYSAQGGIQSIVVGENGSTAVVTESGFKVKETGDRDRPERFTENVPNIYDNISRDPMDHLKDVFYYCSEDAQSVFYLDTSVAHPTPQEIPFPDNQEFHGVRNLRIDSSGNFITFSSNEGFFVLDKKTLEEVSKVENVAQGMLDDQGRIRGINADGRLVVYEGNFAEVITYRADEAARNAIAETLKSSAEKEQDRREALEAKLKILSGQRDSATAQLCTVLAGLTDVGEVATQGDASISGILSAVGATGDPEKEEYFRVKLEEALRERQGQIVQPIIDGHLIELTTILGGELDYDSYRIAENIHKESRSLIGFSPQSTREAFSSLEAELARHEESFIGQESQRIQETVVKVTLEARQAIEAAENAIALSAWISGTNDEAESDYIIIKANLDTLEKESDRLPNKDDLRARILEAKTELQDLLRKRRKELRGKKKTTGEKNKETERALRVGGILEFINTFRNEEYDTREQADNFLGAGEYTILEHEIDTVAATDPQEARRLRRLLKSSVALVMAEIDRKNTAPEGFVRIGKEIFPIREQTEEEEQVQTPRREITLTMTDTQTAIGQNGRPVISGDLAVNVTDASGTKIRRVYEDETDEQALRLGLLDYGSEALSSTIVTNEEARRIQKEYADWKRGDASTIRKGLEDRRESLREYLQDSENQQALIDSDEELPEEYKRLNDEYTKYAIEHNYLLFTHLDKLRGAPAARESFNGFGYIPEWQPYWTLDQQTLKYLEEVAEFGNLQLIDREGLCVIQGHAGTGKDVLLDMLAALTRRPKFDFNASKWDEEGSLTEEVVLRVENGQTETITVPSSIVRGVMTPGAIININEINSWPPPARLFLNSLFDAKRSVNLKTSGKRIVSAEGTLFYATENPGYEGTYDINIASISRQTEVHTDYPPLYLSPGRLNPAEAWRTARSVASLEDTTYEMDPARNEFVQLWDQHINGIANGARDLTPVERFDMDVIKNLVTYADKLRTEFVKYNDGEVAAALPVTQPITGREFRRSAYFLSKMGDAEKVVGSADAARTAKALLEKLFLRHIRNLKDRQEIQNQLNAW